MTCGRLAVLLTAAGLALAFPGVADAELRFRLCREAHCARLSVPLDHSGAVPGRLSLRVQRHRRDAGTPRGVTLLLAPTPGVAATELSTYEWEVPGRDLIAFDPRGTGAGALRCRDLEAATETDAGREAAACATLLGARRGFFRTADTVEDIEALRTELGIERLTIAGTAYGAYVAQRYAMRYPDRVERLLLKWPVDAAGMDPLSVDSMAAVRRGLPALCRPGCARFTSDPLGDSARLVERLGREPLTGRVVGPTGHRRTASLTRQELLYVLLSGADNFLTLSEYPAAVVSALRGDPAPILRLMRRVTARPAVLRPGIWSAAAYAAAVCEEVRFPWPWHAGPAGRDEAAYRAETAMDPSLAAPFDPGALVRGAPMRLCRRWPTVSPGPPPDPGSMPDVPVLVLAAPETLRFPLETARRTAARFPRAKLLEVNGLSLGGGLRLSECADRAVRRFLGGRRVQDRCPRHRQLVPPATPAPRSLSDLAPVGGVPGRRGRLLQALGVTFGDLVDSFYSDGLLAAGIEGSDFVFRAGGLRGGRLAVGDDIFRLDRYEYVPGVRFTGRWANDSDALGSLHIDGPGSLDGVLRVREGDDDLSLAVRGRIVGRRVRSVVPVRSRLLDLFAEVDEGGGMARLALRLRAPNVPSDAPRSCSRRPLRYVRGACASR